MQNKERIDKKYLYVDKISNKGLRPPFYNCIFTSALQNRLLLYMAYY